MNGVGANLQDHLQIRSVYRISNALTLNQRAGNLFGKAGLALEYLLKRSGPLSMAPSQLGIFTRSDPRLDTPDLEYHVQPLSTDRLGEPAPSVPCSHGFRVSPAPAKPRQRPCALCRSLSTRRDQTELSERSGGP